MKPGQEVQATRDLYDDIKGRVIPKGYRSTVTSTGAAPDGVPCIWVGQFYPAFDLSSWAPVVPVDNSAKRKGQPIASGVIRYFPDALRTVAEISLAGNHKHHPDKPLHWDKSKSSDEEDALVRHLTDHMEGITHDPEDGQLNLGKVAWRALAALQRYLDAQKAGTK